MKRILFVTYFAGVEANCPAEWADDRLRAIESLGVHTTVLTNYGSRLNDTKLIKVYKTPSLASDDFYHEVTLKGGRNAIRGFGIYILTALVFIFGRLLKVMTSFLTRGGSGGKWSWLILATPVGLWLGLTRKLDTIYCTGGPPSAYFVGMIVSWVARVPLTIEFQDPLVGAEINKSSYKQRVVRSVELMLLKNADLCVYVTKKAAEDSRYRNPAAWSFELTEFKKFNSLNRPIEILHLGTLYGSRNLDKFFAGLDSLYAEKKIAKGSIVVTNLGSVYTSNVLEYSVRNDFKLMRERQRVDAMRIAKRADFLLLVQHDDNRSAETIPYKLYDYLNLNIPMILLIKNPEIRDICPKNQILIADCGSEQEIKAAIESALVMFTSGQSNLPSRGVVYSDRLEICSQVANLLPKIFYRRS
jgi:hypothetical protein